MTASAIVWAAGAAPKPTSAGGEFPDSGEQGSAGTGSFDCPEDGFRPVAPPAHLLGADFARDDFPVGSDETANAVEGVVQVPGSQSDLWLYRDRTVGVLRRYMRLSIEVGRLPSLLGREFFRTRVTSYHASTFEDAVIFVHDVERGLEVLDEFERKLIAKIVLQEYSQEEAGRLLGCGLRTAARRYPEALDRISEVFLEREILTRLPATKLEAPETCQEGKTEENLASYSEQTKNNGTN